MPFAGEVVSASDTTFPYCFATQGSAQSLANNTLTASTLDAESEDSLSIHDTVTLNTRFVIGRKLGVWLVTGLVTYATNATGTRRAVIQLNGSDVNGAHSIVPPGAALGTAQATGMVRATASTDYVELAGLQNSGGALNTTVSGSYRSSLALTWIGA